MNQVYRSQFNVSNTVDVKISIAAFATKSNENSPFGSASDPISHHTGIAHRTFAQLFFEEHSDIPRGEGGSQL